MGNHARVPDDGTSRRTSAWMQYAACAGEDPRLFFAPDGGETAAGRDMREARAKAICDRCPVRVNCLAYRITETSQSDGGVWGGSNERQRQNERRKLRRRIRRPAA